VTKGELTCKELTELITDYLEQRLSETERARFEQHLAICQACVTYLDQMRFTVKSLGAKPRVEIPKAVESELLQAFRQWKAPR
jgi:anti-sigma factor RsiW